MEVITLFCDWCNSKQDALHQCKIATSIYSYNEKDYHICADCMSEFVHKLDELKKGCKKT